MGMVEGVGNIVAVIVVVTAAVTHQEEAAGNKWED